MVDFSSCHHLTVSASKLYFFGFWIKKIIKPNRITNLKTEMEKLISGYAWVKG